MLYTLLSSRPELVSAASQEMLVVKTYSSPYLTGGSEGGTAQKVELYLLRGVEWLELHNCCCLFQPAFACTPESLLKVFFIPFSHHFLSFLLEEKKNYAKKAEKGVLEIDSLLQIVG